MTSSTTAMLLEMTSNTSLLSGITSNTNTLPGTTSNISVLSGMSGMTSNTTTVLSQPPSFYIWTAAFIFLLVLLLILIEFIFILIILYFDILNKPIHASGRNLLLHFCCNRISNHTAAGHPQFQKHSHHHYHRDHRDHHHDHPDHVGDLNPWKHSCPLDSSLPQKNVESH